VLNSSFTIPDGRFPEGCSVLNLQKDVDDIFPSDPPYKFLVRRDCEDVRGIIQLESDRMARTERGKPSGIVVTGEPGDRYG
jgi:hypothetical protein